jgi:hypothetical protein
VTITRQDRRRLSKAITRFVNATVSDEFKGCGHPDDHDTIERELKNARNHLTRVLDSITEPTHRPDNA